MSSFKKVQNIPKNSRKKLGAKIYNPNKNELLPKAIPNNVSSEFEKIEKMVKLMMEKSQNIIDYRNKNCKAAICKVCGKEGMRNAIKNHIETNHLEGIVIPCNLCDKTFMSRNAIRKHERQHKTIIMGRDKPHNCKMCLYSSACANSLKNHMRVHSGEQPFSCKMCTYTSAWSGSLKKHMQTHEGKPFSCEHCKFACRTVPRMKKHEQTHEKRFSCEQCNFASKTAPQLKTHIKTHPKYFVCGICKLYTTAGILKAHMLRTNGGRPCNDTTAPRVCGLSMWSIITGPNKCEVTYNCEKEFRSHAREAHFLDMEMLKTNQRGCPCSGC